MQLYPLLGGHPNKSFLEWSFPSGSTISFGHLEHENDVLNWQGSQIAYIGFDELTHFSESQFFYMLSRNRSVANVKPSIRATCNPDPDSWVRKFIDWWIGKDGYPIKSKIGRVRYFIRRDDEIFWANSREEIFEQFGRTAEVQPKSVTFIPAKLEDNKILMEKDPAYASNLLAMSRVDRLRLKEGNWDVRPSAGLMFRREWFTIVDAIPAGAIRQVRFWDRAATKPNEENKNPDWTRGIKLYKYSDNTMVVADMRSAQDTPGQIEKLIKATASHDTKSCAIKSQRDPGSAGVAEAEYFTRMLIGYVVSTEPSSKDKVTRSKPVSAQVEAGNIKVLRAPWNDDFFKELENFPKEGSHDDIVDALSGAFNELCGGLSLADVL